MKNYFLAKMTRREFLKNTAELCFKAGLSSIFLYACQPDVPRDQTTPTSEKRDDLGSGFEPAYLKLYKTGELKKRAEKLWSIMENCQLCPRRCGVNRLKGMSGFCRAPGATLVVASFHPHFGEERPLVGNGGSGTIFFTHCNLRCVFCQNWEISQLGVGSETDVAELARMMLRLQEIGCHNLNIVTPTHYSALLLKALDIAAGMGVRLPIVYNTSGWERLEILALLDGIVDIYLPDFKYWDSSMSAKYSSGAESYPQVTKAAILEMNRQVGVAKPAQDGIMQRGLMIRHLVMPNNVAGSEKVMEWIAENLPKNTYVNIMAQYNPLYKAYDYPEISRRITREEYERVVKRAQEVGLTNLDIQGYWWLQG
ncbi:MAG: radical SAM protein [Chloroflexi bacterium]|nr:radical SAM protein [Chloroflexota bacterium]